MADVLFRRRQAWVCEDPPLSQTLSARDLRNRVATTALFVAHGIAGASFSANLPRLQERHGLTDGALGLVLLAFSLGGVVTMPLVGRLAAQVGTARVAGVAGVLVAALLPLPSLAGSWPLLLTAGAALGAASGTMGVAMNARASAVERGRGAAIMSSFHAGWSLAALTGALLAGLLAREGLSLPAALALPAALVALLSAAGLRQRTREARAGGSPGLALPSRRLAKVCAIAVLAFIAEGSIYNWSGIYLRTELGADAAFATSGYAAYTLAMALARIGGDGIVRRIGPSLVLSLGAALGIAGIGGALLTHSPFVADAGFIAAGLGFANFAPVLFSAAGRLQGTHGVAALSFVGYAGSLLAPPLLGAVADAAGLRVSLALVLVGLACVVGFGRAVTSRLAT